MCFSGVVAGVDLANPHRGTWDKGREVVRNWKWISRGLNWSLEVWEVLFVRTITNYHDVYYVSECGCNRRLSGAVPSATPCVAGAYLSDPDSRLPTKTQEKQLVVTRRASSPLWPRYMSTPTYNWKTYGSTGTERGRARILQPVVGFQVPHWLLQQQHGPLHSKSGDHFSSAWRHTCIYLT